MNTTLTMAGIEFAEYVRTCGAKTRAGKPCKRTPNRTGRCHLHGGASLVGAGHPNYKHGFYSKYDLRGISLAESRRTRRCTEFKADGTPCRQWAMRDDRLCRCIAHQQGTTELERVMRRLKIPRRELEKYKNIFLMISSGLL